MTSTIPDPTAAPGEIQRSVLELYLAHPFPQWTPEVRRARLAAELCRYRFLGLEEAMRGARFLDVGCGTGNRSMPVAKHFDVREYVGFDQSEASLAVAERVAREDGVDRFTPTRGDLFALPFPDASFDVAVAWGVLHHTGDPLRGFRELVRVCRPGGYVALFLYNRFAHWLHNRQKDRVSREAGPGIEERFQVAHRLYGRKPVADMTPEEIAYFYDKYCHPHKSDHTLGETLRWFDDLGLRYQGAYLPLGLRDLVACIQYRAQLAEQSPAEEGFSRAVLRAVRRLPRVRASVPPFPRPGPLQRFLWQAYWALRGATGEYSQGAALCARKP